MPEFSLSADRNHGNPFGQPPRDRRAGGRIAIEDAVNLAIYTYNPPCGGSLGTPTHITPLGTSEGPITFAFTKNMSGIYVADNAADAKAFEYAYPAGGSPVSSFNVGGADGIPFGTAVIPSQYPSIGR